MIWGKRRFQWAAYAPYQDRLEKLLMSNAAQYREFMMFSIEETDGWATIYIGLPSQSLMALFDDFENVNEPDLPEVVDTLLAADVSEFSKRFKFRHHTGKS